MISAYAVVRILAAVSSVVLFALFVGVYRLVQAAVENRRKTGFSGKPAFSHAE